MIAAAICLSLFLNVAILVGAFGDGAVVDGLVTVMAACLLAMVAGQLRFGEAGFFLSVARPFAILAMVPALWMLIQILPLGLGAPSDPLWRSAAEALAIPVEGRITIDVGATVQALVHYLSIASIVFVTAAIALNRERIRWILLALLFATALVSSLALAADLVDLNSILTLPPQGAFDASQVAGFGVIVAIAAALWEARNEGARKGATRLVGKGVNYAISIIGLATCLSALAVEGTGQTWFAVSAAAVVLLLAVAVRRLRLGAYSIATLAVVAISIAAAMTVNGGGTENRNASLLDFASRAPRPMIALTQRVLANTRWTGTGAGTFSAVTPLYKNVDDLQVPPVAPTALDTVAVELGLPFLVAALTLSFVFVIIFLRAAFQRRRDEIFPILGASGTLLFVALAFTSEAPLSVPVSLSYAAVLGIAIAQRRSRQI